MTIAQLDAGGAELLVPSAPSGFSLCEASLLSGRHGPRHHGPTWLWGRGVASLQPETQPARASAGTQEIA